MCEDVTSIIGWGLGRAGPGRTWLGPKAEGWHRAAGTGAQACSPGGALGTGWAARAQVGDPRGAAALRLACARLARARPPVPGGGLSLEVPLPRRASSAAHEHPHAVPAGSDARLGAPRARDPMAPAPAAA